MGKVKKKLSVIYFEDHNTDDEKSIYLLYYHILWSDIQYLKLWINYCFFFESDLFFRRIEKLIQDLILKYTEINTKGKVIELARLISHYCNLRFIYT